MASSATYDIRRARVEVLIAERNWRAAYDCAAALHQEVWLMYHGARPPASNVLEWIITVTFKLPSLDYG